MFKSTAYVKAWLSFPINLFKRSGFNPSISPRDFVIVVFPDYTHLLFLKILFELYLDFQHVSLHDYLFSYKLMRSYCGFDVE